MSAVFPNMKNSLLSLALALLAGVIFSTQHAAGAEASDRKPNIILVMPDDAGYGDYSCLGNPIMKTPQVDAFWKESVRLTDFHVSPTCAPTRSALMTGRHEFKNGVTHTILERERMTLKATTIAQVLKSAGYATGIFGKWHLGDEAAYQPNKRGFDEVFIHGGGGIGQTYPGSCGDAPHNMYDKPALMHNGEFVKTEGYCTDVFFSHAIEWMDEKLDKGIPFFAYIPLNAVHAPLQCPQGYEEHWAGKVPPDVAKYYGMLENIDENFGHLLAKLEEWGIEKDTLVIFLGTDNGGTAGVKIYNAGMHGGKGTPYQGGTRAPAFFRWPAKFAGGRDVSALTAHVDMFRTLAEVAGVKLDGELAKQVEGRSLLPLLTQEKVEWPDRTLVTHVGRWPLGKVADAKFSNCSIRDARFTLVNNTELYDLAADPGEKVNVIEQNAEAVAKLRAAYDAWWNDVQPLLVNEGAVGPKLNPFKEIYWKQFGEQPDEDSLRQMDPKRIEQLGGGAKGRNRKPSE